MNKPQKMKSINGNRDILTLKSIVNKNIQKMKIYYINFIVSPYLVKKKYFLKII